MDQRIRKAASPPPATGGQQGAPQLDRPVGKRARSRSLPSNAAIPAKCQRGSQARSPAPCKHAITFTHTRYFVTPNNGRDRPVPNFVKVT